MNEVPWDELSAARFAGLVHTRFQVRADEPGPPVELELEAVTPRESIVRAGNGGAGPMRFESFSLIFHGPASQPLSQGTYRFSQDPLGWFELFIVPVGAHGATRHYEAIFNRRIPG